MATKTRAAEQRLKELGIELPAPPEPFGTYAEAVQTGNLLLLPGMTGLHPMIEKYPLEKAAEACA